MWKITTLTPVHIGTGNTYQAFLIYENNRYEMIDMLLTSTNPLRFLDEKFNRDLTNERRTVSNKDFFQKLNLNPKKLNKKDSSYTLDNRTSKDLSYGNVLENAKNVDIPYIPGSSLKGYILNIIWNDIIEKNSEIRKYYSIYYEKVYQAKTSGIQNDIRNVEKLDAEVKFIMELLGVRDVLFVDAPITLYESNRYLNGKKQNKKIPVGYVEAISENQTQEAEILFFMSDLNMKLAQERKDAIIKNIDDAKIYDLNEDEKIKQKTFKKNLLNEMYNRIINFRQWFPKANQDFMIKIIDKEIDFIDTLDNPEVNSKELRNILMQFKSRLEKGEIIIQLGGFTNFLAKSYGHSFGQLYKEYFKEVFTPDIKKKKVPKIDTMNLIVKNNLGTVPFGFIKIEEL
jgi:CRISPR type III-A-associated RAMP protein Csm5